MWVWNIIIVIVCPIFTHIFLQHVISFIMEFRLRIKNSGSLQYCACLGKRHKLRVICCCVTLNARDINYGVLPSNVLSIFLAPFDHFFSSTRPYTCDMHQFSASLNWVTIILISSVQKKPMNRCVVCNHQHAAFTLKFIQTACCIYHPQSPMGFSSFMV